MIAVEPSTAHLQPQVWLWYHLKVMPLRDRRVNYCCTGLCHCDAGSRHKKLICHILPVILDNQACQIDPSVTVGVMRVITLSFISVIALTDCTVITVVMIKAIIVIKKLS